ncbi:MAG: flavin reductase family protein [Bryobacteraceae bacterium]|jgi:flavin reductase (DIM6/NTAB) family NADH-FMN oxidoreductase RutF
MSSEEAQDRSERVSSDDFRRACGRFTTGVTIASAVDRQGTPHGLTVNSFTSVSLDPPLVMVALAHSASVMDAFREARFFAVNVLAAGQRSLSERFALKGHDRFDGLAWHAGETGAPLLPETLAEIECAVRHRFTAGDHDLIVGEMVRALVREGEPLLYFSGRYRKLAGGAH